MSFHKKLVTFSDISAVAAPALDYLRATYPAFTADLPEEAFLMSPSNYDAFFRRFNLAVSSLTSSGMLTVYPYTTSQVLLIFNPNRGDYSPTVTKEFCRLPKLSHLVTLTPEDFFLLLDAVAAAKPAPPSHNSLALNPTILNPSSHPTLSKFFSLLKTNYRFNPTYSDKKWTSYADIQFLSALSPTFENQFLAIQYLTAVQNDDLIHFPLSSAVDLELDWPQIAPDYCTRP